MGSFFSLLWSASIARTVEEKQFIIFSDRVIIRDKVLPRNKRTALVLLRKKFTLADLQPGKFGHPLTEYKQMDRYELRLWWKDNSVIERVLSQDPSI